MSTLELNASGYLNYGPHKYGAKLLVDHLYDWYEGEMRHVAIDVETDGKDKFVGLALCKDPMTVYYFTRLTPNLCHFLRNSLLVGHNIKFDAHFLTKAGCYIDADNLEHDTMIMSYVRNSTKETHGLKDIAAEYLQMHWPSYKEMVGSGRNKTTLDTKPVIEVANYCGCDVLATYRLFQYFSKIMTPNQKRFYNTIEMPLLRLLYEMEQTGVNIDLDYVRSLQGLFTAKYAEKLQSLRSLVTSLGYKHQCTKSCPKKEHVHEFNPASPKQVKEVLEHCGFHPQATDKFALESLKGTPFVDGIFDFREINKMKSTYIEPYLELHKEGKIHTTFNQVTYDKQGDEWKGIRTGRLSSSNPNLHNIPAPKDTEDDSESIGHLIRRAFIPSVEHTLVCADYSQIEYRLLAHFSKEPKLLEAFRHGKDVHEETGKALGVDRRLGKTLNFAAIYGAQGPKIARTAKIPQEDAKRFLAEYWKVLPRVTSWIHRIKLEARIHKSVRTMFGRVIPIPGIVDQDQMTRWHWERAAVNYVIQGSAADIIKLAMLACADHGYTPILQVHDELLFDMDTTGLFLEEDLQCIKGWMESVVKLDVPLEVKIGSGKNWEAAK